MNDLHLTGKIQTDQYCGQPRSGFNSKNCVKCIELKDKKKSCLLCEKEFTPGCGAKFICRPCLYRRYENTFI